jgi:hypothetical protein
MPSHRRYDFPAISDKEQRPQSEEATRETLFEDHPDWKDGARGPQIGTVRLTSTTSEFTFGDGDKVTYEGSVPASGKGRVRFKRNSGSGKFRGRDDEIDVESVNPKRWG